ncbi:MAG TPA: calcium-binding protein [Rhizomicrobium sp.]|nr:calcium-binding protein [Rhizomicrobium sp.]
MAKFKGTAGDDNLVGTEGNDKFTLTQGGNDSVHAGGGNDKFTMGATLNAGDNLDGGDGTDSVILKGDYSAGVIFTATTITNVEKMIFQAGFDYNITVKDGNVAAGEKLAVDAAALKNGNHLIFDGSNESDGSFAFQGGTGDDQLTGGAMKDTFNLAKGGNDAVHGGAGNDVFTMAGTFTAADSIDGGADTDTLSLNGNYAGANAVTFGTATISSIETIQLAAGHNYDLTTADANVTAGQVLTVDGSALGAADKLAFNGAAEGDGRFAFSAGAGNDTLTGGALNDTFQLSLGGDDIAKGGAGNDVFTMGASLTATDKIDGGANTDTLSLNGDYSAGVTFGAATVVNIETLLLASGHSYNFTTVNATVASGASMTVDGSALAAADTLTFNGGAETDGAFAFLAGAGNDALAGGAKDDSFDLTKGGVDTVHGGGGNDTFNLGATLTAADAVDGGNGIDTLNLDGDYSAGLVFGVATVTGIETIHLVTGHDFNLTTNEATVAANQTLTVDGSALAASRHLTFNGAAESNGAFAITGGAGADNLTGGAKNDSFDLSLGGNDTAHGGAGNDTFTMGAALAAGDAIDGGDGSDTVVLNGDYSAGVTFGANTISGIETILLSAGHAYNLSTNNTNVIAGATLTVDASAADAVTFNGVAETNGFFAILGSTGSDNVTGGSLADSFDLTLGGNDTAHGGDGGDTFNLGATLSASDAIDGGAGTDTLDLDGDYSTGVVFGATTVTNIETLHLAAGHNYNLTTNDATVASGLTLTVDASALGASDALTFNGGAEGDGAFAMIGGAGSDSLTGGAKDDSFDLSHGGNDTVHGGDGSDTINAFGTLTSADAVDGGAGNDVLMLNGDYGAGVTFGAGTMTNVETLRFAAGHSYNIATDDGNVGSGQTLTVDGSLLGAGDMLTFNGAAEANGSFTIGGGVGNDSLTGGAKDDTFDLSLGGNDTVHGGGGNDTVIVMGTLTADDAIDGGTGNDLVTLAGDYSAGLVLGASTIVNIDTLLFTLGHSYNLTTDDGNLASGDVLSVVGSALGAGDTLTFDGSAESDGSFVFTDGAGNDVLSGGAKNDSFTFSKGGNDTARGGGGNDIFTMGATLTTADRIDGGTGNDKVVLDGDYGVAILLGDTTMTNVETLQLTAGHNYGFISGDGVVANGATLTVDASALGAGNALTFVGSAELDGSFAFLAGAGNDGLTGGAQADAFDLTLGGNDTVHGGGGNDSFTLAATLTASDAIDGGAGNDTVSLNGNYSAGLTFGATTLTGIETLLLAAGNSYKFTSNDANVAAGATMIVDASALAGANTLNFNGAAESDGAFRFMFGGNYTPASDPLNGGTHTATTVINPAFSANTLASALELNGDYVGFTIGAGAFSGIGSLVLDAGHSYNISLNGYVFATNQNFIIDGSAMTGNNTIDVSHETHGRFYLIGGTGDDTLIGGGDSTYFDVSHNGTGHVTGTAGDDVIYEGDNTFFPHVDGGAGTDTEILNGDYSVGLYMNGGDDNIEIIQMMESGHAYKLKMLDGTVAAGKTLTIDGGALASALIADGSAETDGLFKMIGGSGDDVLNGGAKDDVFDLTHGGEDTVNSNGGNDVFNMGATLDVSDKISGGGTGTMNLSGDYSAGLTLGATTVTHMQTMYLLDGFNYHLTLNDGNTGNNQQFNVNGGYANNVYIDGSAETNGTLILDGGRGDSTLIGGAVKDYLVVGYGHNTLIGGGGHDVIIEGGIPGTLSDTFIYNAVSDSTGVNCDVIDYFNLAHTVFQVSQLNGAVTGVDAAINSGTLSTATFDTDLANAVNAAHLAGHHAVEFTATAGSLAGGVYLVIDVNGTAGYQAGADLVVQLFNCTGNLTLGDFG